MASGRKDYRAEVIPVKTVYKTDQNRFFLSEEGSIAGAGSDDFCTYTVPVGYTLYLRELFVSCRLPGINYTQLNVGGVDVFYIQMDVQLQHIFSDDAVLTVAAGATLFVSLFNNDSVSDYFYAYLAGFLIPTDF